MADDRHSGPLVGLAPPLTEVAWSSSIVAQSLEALFVCRRDGRISHLRPIHAPSLRLGWAPGTEPGEVVLAAADRYGLQPIVVHSTSWRHEHDRLILTYIAVVEAPTALTDFLVEEVITRSDLARGDALTPPRDIDITQVIEHALRHLAWLVGDDPAIGNALPDWTSSLADREPEPFRAFSARQG